MPPNVQLVEAAEDDALDTALGAAEGAGADGEAEEKVVLEFKPQSGQDILTV